MQFLIHLLFKTKIFASHPKNGTIVHSSIRTMEGKVGGQTSSALAR